MADWLDDPELYKPAKAPKSGGDDWLDDPALYVAAPDVKVDLGKVLGSTASLNRRNEQIASNWDALTGSRAAPVLGLDRVGPAPAVVYDELGAYIPTGAAGSVRPDRSMSALGQDLAATFKGSAREGVTSLLKAPVTAVNSINAGANWAANDLAGLFGQTISPEDQIRMASQPEWLRNLDSATHDLNQGEYQRSASGALRYDDENAPSDLRGSINYTVQNPGSLLTDVSRTAGSMLPTVIPGATGLSIGLQATQQAQQTADQVEQNLLRKGVDAQTAKAEASKAFAAAAGIGAVAPRMFEGGQAFEKLLTGTATRGTGTAASRIGVPLLGEIGSEVAEETGIQLTQNDYSRDPLTQGLGAAGFKAAVLGGGMGAIPAGVEAVNIGQERLASRPGFGPIPDNTERTPEDIASAEIETALDDETFANRPAAPLSERVASIPVEATPVVSPETAVPVSNVAPVADADAPFRRPVETPVSEQVAAGPESVPDSAFNADSASVLSDGFYSESFDAESGALPLANSGFRPDEIASLEAAGMATDGAMNYQQFAAYQEERSLRTAGGRKKPKPAPVAPEVVAAEAPVAAVGTRESPIPQSELESAPVGAWVDTGIPDSNEPGGRALYQVREVPVADLYLPELGESGDIAPEKRSYMPEYERRAAAGEQPPTLHAVEMDDGRIRVTDGHRRALAAKRAGKETVRVLVGPKREAPTAERLYSDYNPEASQTVTRVDGNLSFPESRLTRRALDDALSDPDPVNAAERLLTNIAEQPDIRPEQKWLAEKLAPLMKLLGVKLIEPNPSQPYAGAYSNTDNTVYIRQADPETALHETTHGVTSALATDPAARADPVVARAQDELAAMHSHLQTSIGLGEIDTSNVHPEVRRLLDDKQGPLSNVKELIAYGLSNRPFQDFLKSLPPPPGREQARNMWEYFKSVVTSMFGAKTDAQRSYLDALIESSADLIDFAGKNPQATKVVKEVAASRLTPAEKLEPTPPSKPPAPKPEPATPKPERPPTSTKNSFVDEDRERAGKEPIARAEPRSNETTLEMGKAAIADNPDLPAELIARLSVSGVSSINSVEEAALQVESERLRAERDRQADRAADPALTESARAIARQKFDEAEAAIDQIDAATHNSGTEWGRFGQYRQRALRDDFTLAALERKARAVKGEPLTAEETGKLREMAKVIAERDAAKAETQRLKDEYESGAAVEQTYKRLLEDMRKPRGPVDVAALKERAERAKAALRELAGTDAAVMTDAATLTPQQALIDLGAYHYADGGKTLPDWTKRMEADVPAQYREGLADLFELSKAGAARPVIEPGKLTHKNVYDLALAEVRNGVKGEDAVMKAVFEAVRADNPGLTERDVRRLFTEYGKQRFPTRDADRARVAELKSLVKMEESIKRMEEGLAPMKGAPRAARSEEIRQRQAEYNAARKAFERKFPDPDADARYQRGRATSLARQLAEVQERLRTGDYEKAVRIPKELDEANTKAAYELKKAREVFLRQQFEWEMAKRTKLEKMRDFGKDILALPQPLITSLDLSALLRQGGLLAASRWSLPFRILPTMFRSFKSAEAAHAAEEKIKNSKNYELMKRGGLELTTDNPLAKLSDMEEKFRSRWIERFEPKEGETAKNALRTGKNVATAHVRASNRAFVATLNGMRAMAFDAMLKTWARDPANPTLPELKAISRYINLATGRGEVPGSGKRGPGFLANATIFAPRLLASRFNMLYGLPYAGGTARTKAMVAAEYARIWAGAAVVLALGKMLWELQDDDDKENDFIEKDPRSTNFGKMRFGDTYIDPFAGFAQTTTFLTRIATGESKTQAGEIVPLRKEYRPLNLLRDEPMFDKPRFGMGDAASEYGRFLRTKLAPIPGAAINLSSGTDPIGNEVTPASAAVSLVTPLTAGDIVGVMEANGVAKSTAATLAAIFGMGVQNRDPASRAPDFKEMSRAEKNTYGEYAKEAKKITKAKSDLQDFANSLPEDMSAGDIRYEVEKKAAELGLEGATVDVYKRDTTARDDKGNRRRGVKRSETGSVKMNWKQAYSLSGFSAADKTVSAIDSDIEALDEDDITNAELEKIHGKYVFSPLTDGGDTQASDDDIESVRKTLRWHRKWSQDNFVKEQAK